MNVKINFNRRELAGLLTGGTVAGATLITQHYGLRRAHLRRTDAYVAGTIALDIGFAAYSLVAKKPLYQVVAFFVVEALAGATVKVMYLVDRKLGTGPQHASLDIGMLEETLRHNDELRTELAELRQQVDDARDMDGLISPEDLLEMSAHIVTASHDVTKVKASLEAYDRKNQAFHQRLRMSMTRRRAALKGANKKPAYETGSGN